MTPTFDGYQASPEFPTFAVRAGAATAQFVAWLSRWPDLWDSLRDRTTGLGLRRQRVPVDRLLTAKIPLPSLDEQARIIERMDRVEQLRIRLSDRAAAFAAIERSVLHRSLTGLTLS